MLSAVFVPVSLAVSTSIEAAFGANVSMVKVVVEEAAV